jgi:hypothetical protein
VVSIVIIIAIVLKIALLDSLEFVSIVFRTSFDIDTLVVLAYIVFSCRNFVLLLGLGGLGGSVGGMMDGNICDIIKHFIMGNRK